MSVHKTLILRVLILFLGATPNMVVAQDSEAIAITGTVKDKLDAAMEGVTIENLRSREVVATNAQGQFSIRANKGDSLTASYIGFQTFRWVFRERIVENISLEAIAGSMNDVVVVGYGRQKKVSLVGAQSTIKAEELQHPVANLSTMLAGRIAGLVGVQRSGLPGSNSADVWIRGIQTFGGSQSGALIIIDGIQGRDLNSIDPEDIASFTVLKDAASTAVYGSLGANGVVLITTKKGKTGKINLMVNYNEGITTFTKVQEMADAKTYMNIKNEALIASGLQPQFSQAYIDSTLSGTANPYVYPNIDWIDYLFKNYSSNRRFNFSASGGSENTKFYTSVAYYNEASLLKTDPDVDYDAGTRYQRYNFTSNIDMNWTKTTKFSLGITGYITNFNEPGSGATQAFAQAMNASPVFYPPMYPGNLVSGIAYGSTPSPNPWAAVTQTGYVKRFQSKVQSNARLEQDLSFWLKGLSVNGTYSFDVFNESFQYRRRNRSIYYLNQAQHYKEDGSLNLEQMINGSDDLGFGIGNGGVRQFTAEGQILYDRTFGAHHVTSTLVYNQLSQVYPFQGDLKQFIPHRQQNYAGRATYSYKDKYFTEVNIGYNGSEDYAPSRRFGFFPSFGVGWVLSNEKFFEPLSNVFQFFKLRYSNGIAGAPGTGLRFGYLTLITTGARGINFGLPGNSTGISGINISQYGADVSWATAHTQDLGLEFNVFNNKLSFVLDYFKSYRTGVFLTRADFPSYAGLQYNPVGNYGTVDASGFDGTVELKAIPLGLKSNISFRGTFTYNTDVLVENKQAPFADPYQERRGQNILAQFGYVAEGLFQSQAEIDNSPDQSALGNPRVGDIKYKDLNGDGVINVYDQTKISRGDVPNLVYGFGFNVNVGQFYLSAFFQGLSGAYRTIGGVARVPFSGGGNDGNVYANIVDRWTEDNHAEHPFYPRLGFSSNATANNNQASTWWVKDISFIRFKTLDLGYNLPKGSFKRIGMQNARIYFSGVNLLYWSPFKLWDPEMNTGDGNTYPNTRNLSIGIQANF
ncbi:TonB-dependent receptor [Niabella sp. CC-SYL272]|uniref:SusC/RagA family TonB-linked outer membrane protein n=1 Tax=Niabella agricola TaxID=2891571 RepID=UPI001F3E059B|nr:TonB-dependent receptor [Niabella agricola]MCF3112160.1 TonB-dependent receptor [Niabella agricola]